MASSPSAAVLSASLLSMAVLSVASLGACAGPGANSGPGSAQLERAVTVQAVVAQAVTPRVVTVQAVTPRAVTVQAVTPRAVIATAPATRVWSVVIPWGAGPGAVGRTSSGPEIVPQGPSALALGPDGAVYVLDRLNDRVIRVTPTGCAPVARVERDAEDLAFGQGVLAAYSPLRARVTLRRPSGRPAGEDLGVVAVPRALRGVVGLRLGPSLQVSVRVAHQETYRVGSPHAPRSLGAVLHSKREGGWRLDDLRGVVVVRRSDGRPELRVVAAREAHAPVLARWTLSERVLAARVVGVVAASPSGGLSRGDGVCLRLERAGPDHGPRIDVRRRLVCLDLRSNARWLDVALPLPARGDPLLRREVAVAAGGDTVWVAHAWAAPDGLHLTRWAVIPAEAAKDRESGRGGQP